MALKDEIEALIQRGYLREFVAGRQAQPKERNNTRNCRNSPPRIEQTQRQRGNSPTEIRTIFGGHTGGSSNRALKAYARSAYHHVNLTEERPAKELRTAPYAITFSDEDFKGVHHPHDDALVVSMTIANFKVRRILVDNGSSADILY